MFDFNEIREEIKNNGKFYSERNLLMFDLLNELGLRTTELAQLRIDDFNFKDKLLKVRALKGSIDRYIPVSDILTKRVEVYYFNHPNEFKQLFITRKNRCMNKYALSKIINSLDTCSGLTTRSFRHKKARELFNSGHNVFYIQAFLGHREIDNILTYLGILSEDRTKFLEKQYTNFLS